MDNAESIRAIHYALDEGINFFDTAANYGCGHSERILGQAIAGQRDRVIIATKFGYVIDEKSRIVTRNDENVVNRIRQECEASLRRLKTDYIDLYQFHKGAFHLSYKVVKRRKVTGYTWNGCLRQMLG